MSDIKVRGYTIIYAAEYLRRVAGEEPLRALSPSLRRALETATNTDWQAVGHLCELFHAVADLGHGDEAKARAHLEACGRVVGEVATRTFLRLLMKLLTPTLFAKKLPMIWQRDTTGGRYVVDVYDDHMHCHLKDMEAFEHFAPTAVGYVGFAMNSMGKEVTKSVIHGWSLATPATSDMSFELYWKP